ncbi:hypothetical protein [Pseudoalteromonas sp. S16_S37]|uniref:hypothetical protein n=1 Tax=Pseudoalteromonas sp. S16_S37 TaxID=2720228 RepID=UPI001681041C|nr:hypothetical protein [Pseudoalteromonas sp. S16_S37]MBD1580684.1 hypothetical protein [Pseudoalteromonas sp. S16_S37]
MWNKSRLGVCFWGAAFLLVLLSTATWAGPKAQQIINRAISTYGGAKLTELNSITVRDTQLHFSQWQSGHVLQGDMVSYLNEQQLEFAIDFSNQRKVFKRATTYLVGAHSSNSPSVLHRLYSDGKGYGIDHALEQTIASQRVTFANADLGQSQLVDTLIVKQLNDDKAASLWSDIAFIQGQAHDVLTVFAGTKQEYVVYINQQTGYLARVLKRQGGQQISYDFLNHQQSQGLVWAKQLFAGTEKGPLFYLSAREVSFNATDNMLFLLPEHYKPRPAVSPVDVSKRTIRALAQGVYYVGQDWSYSLFIDVGDYFISAGAWQMDEQSQDWLSNVALLRQTTGNNKPIKQHVISHHHTDHLMGVKDVLAQGAALVMHPNHAAAVQAHLNNPLLAEQLIKVSEHGQLAAGKVQLFDVPNSHANHNLVIYLPEHKLLFTEDMFGSSFKKAFNSPSNWPDVDTYHRLAVLMDKMAELGIEVEQLVSSHHYRVSNKADIEQAKGIKLQSKELLLKRLFATN